MGRVFREPGEFDFFICQGRTHGTHLEKGHPPGQKLKLTKFSVQLRVLRLGLLQDGDVGVGVFPECMEIFVGGASLSSVTGKRVGTGKAEMPRA